MQPVTQKRSGLKPIRKITVDHWSPDGSFTMTTKVAALPKLSASKKCYIYSFEHGETPIEVNIDGKVRKVRLTFMLYVKIPASERRASLAEDARRADAAGEPKLF